MTKKDIITGSDIEINVRENADSYEIMQEVVRTSAQEWQTRIAEKSLGYAELLHDTRIFEKYAKKYGLQREFRDNGVI